MTRWMGTRLARVRTVERTMPGMLWATTELFVAGAVMLATGMVLGAVLI